LEQRKNLLLFEDMKVTVFTVSLRKEKVPFLPQISNMTKHSVQRQKILWRKNQNINTRTTDDVDFFLVAGR
jgi:hypothetical protein